LREDEGETETKGKREKEERGREDTWREAAFLII